MIHEKKNILLGPLIETFPKMHISSLQSSGIKNYLPKRPPAGGNLKLFQYKQANIPYK
jgi:hypothetical protein